MSGNLFVLITGATSGFGYEFARLFANHGYNLVLVARSEEQLKKVGEAIANHYRVRVDTLPIDLFRPEGPEQIYQYTLENDIQVDILINNASQGQHGMFVDYELERDVDLIQLNITSVVALTKLFLRDMVARNDGKILQVSSVLAKFPAHGGICGGKSFYQFVYRSAHQRARGLQRNDDRIVAGCC